MEDNSEDAFLFSIAKRSHPSFAVQTVWNGQQAIDYLEGRDEFADRLKYPPPDIIVLDLRMPVFDGFQFLAWRSTSNFASVPVVVLAAMDNQQQGQVALQMGALMAYSKPIVFDGLRGIVAEICSLQFCNQKAA